MTAQITRLQDEEFHPVKSLAVLWLFQWLQDCLWMALLLLDGGHVVTDFKACYCFLFKFAHLQDFVQRSFTEIAGPELRAGWAENPSFQHQVPI